MAEAVSILDLTAPERPTVRLDQGDFKMRHPEEMRFRDVGQIVACGEQVTELVEAGIAENADELDKLIGEAVEQILIEPTPEVLGAMTPARFRRIFEFFNKLATGVEDDEDAEASENASSSSPGANDSTVTPEAD